MMAFHTHSGPMHTVEEKEGDILIVTLQGHLDGFYAEPFEARVAELIDAGANRIVLDCEGLSYINSGGLKTFLVLSKRLESSGGKLVFCSLLPNIAVIFETIGFNRILTIALSRQEAVDQCNGEATAA